MYLYIYITWQFNFSSLLGMCHSRGLKSRINNLHKKAQR